MVYIIYDLEFNQDIPIQDIPELDENIDSKKTYPFEIIQIGALKFNDNLQEIGRFNRYVKPSIYKKICPFISELTGITTQQLKSEECFKEVYQDFIEFIENDNKDAVFVIWGLSDMKELYKNVRLHQLNDNLLPRKYINLQPYASKYLGMSSKKMLRLQSVVEALCIPMEHKFHDALNDASYTAEIFKKIYDDKDMVPKIYDPNYVKPRLRQAKKEVDYEKLFAQLEKMFDRVINDEDKKMIKLAYLMGKTQQFTRYRY